MGIMPALNPAKAFTGLSSIQKLPAGWVANTSSLSLPVSKNITASNIGPNLSRKLSSRAR
jgi:hypothetical protein